MMIDVILEAHAKGWKTFFWEKEHSIYGAGIRSDFYLDLRKGDKTHLYYGESQRSDLTVELWIKKLQPYFELYEKRVHPFYVLIRCTGAYNHQRALLAINELLKDRNMRRPFLIQHQGQWFNRSGEVQELLI